MDNVVIKFTAESELNKANADLQSLKDSENDIIGAMRKLQAEYQKQTAQIQGSVKGTNAQVAALDKLRAKTEAQQKALESELKTTKRNIGELAIAMTNMDETVTKGVVEKTIRQQIKALKDQIATVKEGGADYDILIGKLGELLDKQSDIQAAASRAGSDTRMFDTMYEGAQLAAGGFSIAQGAMSLFGTESEELEQTMVKLQSAIAITTGLQSIGNALQKESNIMMAIGEIQKKALVTAENLDTAAKSKNIVVSKAATAAQWLLNQAAAANPYVLLALAIMTVVGALYIFSQSGENSAEVQKKLNEVQAIAIEQTERYYEKYKLAGDERVRQIQSELDLMKAQGKSNEEIASKELELATKKASNAALAKGYHADEIANLERNRQSVEVLLNALDKLTMTGDKEVDVNINGKIKSLDKESLQGMIDNLNKKVEIGVTATNDDTQASNERKQLLAKQAEERKAAALKESVAAGEVRVLMSKKYSEIELQANIELINAERVQNLANVNLTASERKKINISADKSIVEARRAFNQQNLEDDMSLINAKLALAKEGSEEEFGLKKNSLFKQYEIEMSQADLTPNKKLEIYNKYLKALDELDKKHNQDSTQSILNTEQSNLNAKLSVVRKGSIEELNAKLDSLDNQAAADKLAAGNSIKDETERAAKILEIEAKLSADRLALTNDFSDRQTEKTKNSLLAELKLEQDALDEKVARSGASYATNQKYRELELEGIEIERQALIASYDENIDDEEVYLQKMADLKERERQFELEGIADAEAKKQAIISKSVELFKTIMSSYYDGEKAKIEQQQHDLDTYYTSDVEKARENASLKLISENELAKRKLQLKREAAQADKKQAMFQAGINGAVAIVSALKDGGIVLAAIVGAAVLAEEIAIENKPLPTYWKGKKSSGGNGGKYSRVGEYGPEIMWVPDNAGILPAHHSRSMADAVAAMPGFGIPIPGVNEKGIPGFYVDYDRLGKAVADNIPEQKHVSVIVNKDGITTQDGSDITTSLNTKYSS